MKNTSAGCLVIYLLGFMSAVYSQVPSYINEKPVTITGYTLDAMEPHLSADGNAMFFNSLNDGITTSLHYAAKINDTTFNYIGLVPVVNQTITPRLDGVASLDSANNFYWVSTRTWPGITENLHRIRFLQAGYTNFGRVYGNFYINASGWLIMDAAVNYYGDKLLYCNAWFNNCFGGAPCKSAIGLAQKLNDSTFNKMPIASTWFNNVNDTVNHIVYAPFLTKDELELYYTRLLKNGTQTEIMVATRTNTNSAFGTPALLIGAPAVLPEAAALTADKSKLYFHKKQGSTFQLFLRYRSGTNAVNELENNTELLVYPNPVRDYIYASAKGELNLSLYAMDGRLLRQGKTSFLNISDLPGGLYFLEVKNKNITKKIKLIKE